MSFWRRRRERDLTDEIRSHLQMAARDRMERGETAEAADQSAHGEFGNVALVKEVTREMWGGRSIHILLQDAHYALRTMRRSPGFASVTILTLALGIGANAALFSIFDAVLLKMLPVQDPRELFVLQETGPHETGRALVSYPLFQRLRAAMPTGVELLASTIAKSFTVTAASGATHPADGQLVSGEYFAALRVRPIVGRLLTPGDDQPVVSISYTYWERRYNRDPQAVGSAITINGAPFTIVGVAEPGFFGLSVGERPDIWAPLMMQAQIRYSGNRATSGNSDSRKPWPPQEDVRWLHVMARIPSIQSPQSLAAVLNVVFRQDLERGLQFRSGERERQLFLQRRVELQPGGQGFSELRAGFSRPLRVLMAMVGVVLLIVCANLANLLLSRATARRKEIAIRLSIGASRARVLRQLLTESTLLGLLGGAVGLLLAVWGSSALPRLFSIGLDLKLDFRVAAFTAALSVSTGILLGLAPALGSTGVDPGLALKTGSAGFCARRRSVFGKGLVIAQVALSLLLITGAGLLVRTFWNLLHMDFGFDRDHVLSVRIDPRLAGFKQRQLPGLYTQIVDRVKTLPGVQSAALSLFSVGGGTIISGIHVPGYVPKPLENMSVQENFVDPGYFSTMGITLLEGRDFDSRDEEKSPRVAIVNQSMAQHYFNGASPIGRRFAYGPGSSGFEIVGLVRDAKLNNFRERIQPLAYHPLRQELEYAGNLEVRAGGDTRALGSQLRKAIKEVAPNLPVQSVTTLAERVSRTVGQERLLAQLSGFFASAALLLACIGIYGLVSYAVVRRTPEIGLRIALGASPSSVVRIMVREAVTLVVAGLAIGFAALIPAARLIQAMLFGVTPADPVTIVSAAAAMLGVVLLAAYLPARRASRVDPMAALRYE